MRAAWQEVVELGVTLIVALVAIACLIAALIGMGLWKLRRLGRAL